MTTAETARRLQELALRIETAADDEGAMAWAEEIHEIAAGLLARQTSSPPEEASRLKAEVDHSTDVGALVQSALRESYLESREDLRNYAEKVRFFNRLKRQIREELCRLREHRANYPGVSPPDEIAPIRKVRFEPAVIEDEHGCLRVETVDVGEAKTIKELDCYLESLELERATVGDDAQLANVDLQNWLQREQQTLQTMSNISKSLHDTAMAVIHKFGQ